MSQYTDIPGRHTMLSLAHDVTRLNHWVTDWPPNAERSRDGLDMMLLLKIAEELGEVSEAYLATVHGNPRKVGGHIGAVRRELLDVALSALVAYEHFSDEPGTCVRELAAHARDVSIRTGDLTADLHTDRPWPTN